MEPMDKTDGADRSTVGWQLLPGFITDLIADLQTSAKQCRAVDREAEAKIYEECVEMLGAGTKGLGSDTLGEPHPQFIKPKDVAGYALALGRIKRLKKELALSDVLLKDRSKLLEAIPQCPAHGPCVPHALEWISQVKTLSKIISQA